MKKILFTFFFVSLNALASSPSWSPVIWDAACSSGIYSLPAQACLVTGSGNGITALTGDGSATGPGSVPFTLEAIQGNSVSGTTGTGKVVFSNSPTFTTSIIDPLIIGGTAAGSSLSLESTSGVGTTDFINFLVGDDGDTEAMRIIDSGNIGIGTTTPATPLEVAIGTPIAGIWNGGGYLRVDGDTGIGGSVWAADGFNAGNSSSLYGYTIGSYGTIAGVFWSQGFGSNEFSYAGSLVLQATQNSTGDIFFGTGSSTSTRMLISSSGNIGIGTITPSAKLDVEGSGGVILNAGNTTLGSNLLPTTTNTQTLGASGNVWANVYATTFIGALSGNASTATALAATPSQCTGSQFATGIAANGNANCATPSGGGGTFVGVKYQTTYSGSVGGGGAPIPFDTVVYDANGDWNTTTNLYTAPSTGHYMACINITGNSSVAPPNSPCDIHGNDVTSGYSDVMARCSAANALSGVNYPATGCSVYFFTAGDTFEFEGLGGATLAGGAAFNNMSITKLGN